MYNLNVTIYCNVFFKAVELESRIPDSFVNKLKGEGENDNILVGNNKVIFCIYRIFLITTGEIVL